MNYRPFTLLKLLMLVVMSENLRLVFVGTFLLSLIFSVSSGLLTDDDDDIFLQEGLWLFHRIVRRHSLAVTCS